MRLDDDPSDGPELVLREAPAPIDAPRRGGSGMLTGVLMLVLLVAAVALGFYGRGWWNRGAVHRRDPGRRRRRRPCRRPRRVRPGAAARRQRRLRAGADPPAVAEARVGHLARLGQSHSILRRVGRQDRGRVQPGQGAQAGGAARQVPDARQPAARCASIRPATTATTPSPTSSTPSIRRARRAPTAGCGR